MSNDNTTIDDLSLSLTADIVIAFVTNNVLPAKELPGLISQVYATISGLGAAPTVAPTENDEIEHATPGQIRKSITPEALISFIDGKPYKALKRHLRSHGLDPVAYRRLYGLPDDYPMVASNYSVARSALAKKIGLGRSGGPAKHAA
ncbi:MucR family transcriptional regulator [Methylobacterium organophilum]|uniref:MucR family transcriptional regulator n=1 Tax=Methylobacterium organophilum TaxID=410 RepID=UPI001F13F61E|nr:MucR family transcriptional regulator [Methylobacterium organophilum]UMY19106.1 MucR family transcriptional regulator [Methylobacterium organophilum]